MIEITKVPGNITKLIDAAIARLYGTTPTIFNLVVALANTEVSQALPANTKKILFRCRGAARIQFSFVSGQSGILYVTVPAGASYSQDLLLLPSATLYLQTSLPNQIVEILVWA